jgi:lipopolysaccharide export LptBFGC system permease protein LptF
MKTVRRLLYRDVLWSVVFVAIAFLSLFFFIDFLDELEDVGSAATPFGTLRWPPGWNCPAASTSCFRLRC